MGPVRTLTDGCRTARQSTKPFPARTLPCKLNKENTVGDTSGLCLALLLGTVPQTHALYAWCSMKLGFPLQDKPEVKFQP